MEAVENACCFDNRGKSRQIVNDILLTFLLVFSHAYSGRKSVIEMAFMCIAVSFP